MRNCKNGTGSRASIIFLYMCHGGFTTSAMDKIGAEIAQHSLADLRPQRFTQHSWAYLCTSHECSQQLSSSDWCRRVQKCWANSASLSIDYISHSQRRAGLNITLTPACVVGCFNLHDPGLRQNPLEKVPQHACSGSSIIATEHPKPNGIGANGRVR